MYGAPGNIGANMQEQITDNWIQQNVPGGLNSPLGQQLDNMMGGNPNPTYGQMIGGAHGFGGFGNMGGGYPGNMGGGYLGNMGGGFPGQQYGSNYGYHHHHHHHHHY